MTIKHTIGKFIFPFIPIHRRVFNMVRSELNAFGIRLKYVLYPSYVMRLLRLRTMKHISLNVGCGGRCFAGWVNTDIRPLKSKEFFMQLDIRRKLPFQDRSVKRIFAEHVIEHIDFTYDIPKTLAEFYRVLEHGGTLRISVPDTQRFLQAYVYNDLSRWRELGWNVDRLQEHIYTQMHVLNLVFQQSGDHLFAYDFETLSVVLKKAGFKTVLRSQYNGSADDQLRVDCDVHKLYSLYVEALKE